MFQYRVGKKYLNPTIGEVSTKPTKLATIEASSVRGTDGSYDMSSVPEGDKKGGPIYFTELVIIYPSMT